MTSEPSADHVSFSTLVLSLATSAAVHFGDLGDPETGERSPLNLDGARQMIDLLGMLQDKTKGNLTPEEGTILERILFELRLRFVEAEKQGSAPDPKIIIP